MIRNEVLSEQRAKQVDSLEARNVAIQKAALDVFRLSNSLLAHYRKESSKIRQTQDSVKVVFDSTKVEVVNTLEQSCLSAEEKQAFVKLINTCEIRLRLADSLYALDSVQIAKDSVTIANQNAKIVELGNNMVQVITDFREERKSNGNSIFKDLGKIGLGVIIGVLAK